MNYVDYLSEAEAQEISLLMPGNQNIELGEKVRYALMRDVGFPFGDKYYVDGTNGNNANDGLSWQTAFKTIQFALNKARYLPGTTTINSAKDQHKWIFVGPGQYNEQLLFSGYNIHLIGVSPLSNGDYGVVVNYNDAIASTAVLGFTGSGLEIANICFNSAHAIPIILLADTSDAVHIHDCWIKGDNSKTVTIGISCEIKNSIIENNIINGCITGIDVAAGAWFNNSIIRNNKLTNCTNLIAIAATAVCTESEISRNKGVGSSSSIVNGQATDIIITENRTKPAISDAGAAAGDNTTLA
jgi:hypothetical protein